MVAMGGNACNAATDLPNDLFEGIRSIRPKARAFTVLRKLRQNPGSVVFRAEPYAICVSQMDRIVLNRPDNSIKRFRKASRVEWDDVFEV